MCWIKNDSAKFKFVTEDVYVNKIFNILPDGTLTSFVHGYIYEIGKRYNSDIHIQTSINEEIIIRKGLHSYSPDAVIDYCPTGVTIGTSAIVDRNKNAIFKCIIPKGSMYVENEDNEVVSSSLIVSNYIIDIKNLPKKSIKFLGDCKLIKYENS